MDKPKFVVLKVIRGVSPDGPHPLSVIDRVGDPVLFHTMDSPRPRRGVISDIQLRETGDWDLLRAQTTALLCCRHSRAQISRIKKKESERSSGSGPTPVARGGSGAKAPPLAARPVPWNGPGRRLVALTEGCYSGGHFQ